MKRNRVVVWMVVLPLLMGMLSGCTRGEPSAGGERITVEMEDGYGETLMLDELDLYYQFYAGVRASGVLAYGWEDASEIDPYYLINYFADQTRWFHADDERIVVGREAVEQYILRRFDVSVESLRSSSHYLPEEEAYEIPLIGGRVNDMVSATAQGNRLTISYETYDLSETHVIRRGNVTIEVDAYPHGCRYLSNELTYTADA